MKLNFSGDIEKVKEGIEILSERLCYTISDDGLNVVLKNTGSGLKIKCSKSGAVIEYSETVHFFRALGILVDKLKRGEDFCIAENPNFRTLGAMFDCSRNAVPTVKSVKDLLEIMSVMGFNMMMLYTEDTYEMKNHPYFGYMRGRYTYEELKEIDDYAFSLGIEIIPCIQTLAHLKVMLKWKSCGVPKDTNNILLADDEKTYEFIEDMITAASKPFRSNRIHIGMDEAEGLGTGEYFRRNGYKPAFDIMCKHLERVRSIAEKHNLKPMMWNDMFFKLASKINSYRDTEVEFTDEIVAKIPKNVDMVYWSYVQDKQDFYEIMFEKQKKMGCDVIFAGGIPTWGSVAVRYKVAFKVGHAALKACLKKGVKEVFVTTWGDDGSEVNVFSAILGLQIYAEYGYQSKEVTDELIEERFRACTGENMNDFLKMSHLDAIPDKNGVRPADWSNPAKFLLYQDLMLGFFDEHVKNYPIADYYSNLTDELCTAYQNAGKYKYVFSRPLALAKVLALKCDMGLKITNAYKERKNEELKKLSETELPKLKNLVNDLRNIHREQWLKTYKPFGWEVLDNRYGGIMARIDSAIFRINQYLNGVVENLPELEEKRLGYDTPVRDENAGFGSADFYEYIITSGHTGFWR